MTRWIVPPVRRCIQAISLIVLVLLPILAIYTHYREARAIDDLPKHDWRSTAVKAVDRFVDDQDDRKTLVQGTQGTFWSARLAGVSLTDPLAGLETIASSRILYRRLLWSLLIPVVASLILGRVFCGWICPMNTLLEVVDKLRRALGWLELKERDVKFSLKNKYLIAAIALIVAGVTATPFLALVYPPAVLSREVHQFVFNAGIGLGCYLIVGIAAFELFVSRRWWCRYICPGGAVYSLLGRFRLLRVRRKTARCIECGDCNRVCQFDVRPMLVQTTGMECTNCAACISSCRSRALGYSIVLPLPTRSTTPDRTDKSMPAENLGVAEAEETSSLSTGTEIRLPLILLLAICVVGVSPAAATAHHILGLPHYSYKENYPQAPTLEYPATSGPYDILMTSYPGKPVPNEPAVVAFYIKNRQTNEPYANPVTVRVLQTFTFGDNRVIQAPESREPFDNEHKFTLTFPEDAEYIVELTLDVEGKDEVIPFLVVAGEPTATGSVLVTLGIGLAVFLVVVRAIKKKRDRKKIQASQALQPDHQPGIVNVR